MAERIPLASFPETDALQSIVLAVEGVRLFEIGQPINDEIIAALRDLKFDPLVLARDDAEAEAYIKQTRYALKPLKDLRDDEPVALAVYDDKERLLIQAGQTIPAQRRDMLIRVGIFDVFVDNPLPEETELRIGKLMLRVQQAGKRSTRAMRVQLVKLPKLELRSENIISDSSKLTPDLVDQLAEEALKREEKPEGEPLSAKVVPIDPLKVRPTGRVKHMIEVHSSVLRSAEQIFAQIRASRDIDGQTISALANHVVTGLVNDRSLSLNLSGISNSPHLLVSHSVNTVLLSVHIAAELGFSAGQIHELAYGALLHDVGMARIAPELVNKKGELNKSEKLALQQHPVIGINILQRITRLPKSAPIVVYQENERIDGSGYPKGRSRQLIHTYAKIVQVAAMYEAMTAERPHRKPMLPYFAMEALLKQVSQGKLEPEVVRALLKVLSLFPVGSWLRLNDGSVARVVSSNRENFTRPVVSVIFGGDGRALTPPKPIDLSDKTNADLKVIEAISIPVGLEADLRTVGF